MAIQPGVWGIDLGQCALKAVRVEIIDGYVTATAFDYVEHPKILSQPDADPDMLTREALEKFLSRNNLRHDLVVISVPAQSGLARFVKLPPVEEKKIPDIVRFEAKQQIPFNLDEVVWDYQKLGDGIVTDGFAMETEIGLFAIKRDTVNRYLQHFQDVNVEVNLVQMAPLALCNYVSYDLMSGEEAVAEDAKKPCVVALDIGTDSSNLVITDGRKIIWQRPLNLGGNHFTRALTKDMKLTFAKAEHLKRNATKSPELKQILASLKPVLNDFVGEVQRSLGYFTNTHRDASIQYMLGLGSAFRLPGLQKFIAEKLQLDVRKLTKLEKLRGDDVINSPVFNENVLSFAVSYGLALQGLQIARLQTNLLPHEIRVERQIRAKKPWALTAAAALLLGGTVLGIGYNVEFRAYASSIVREKIDDGKKVKTEVDGYSSKYNQAKAKIQSDILAVKSVVIGQEERINWLKFNQFLTTTLPKPDASNLSAEAKQKFWTESPRAQDAYRKFVYQQTGTGDPGRLQRDEEQWRDDLIQANIENVFCVYSQDLSGYMTGVKERAKIPEWLSKKDLETPPTGSGWVVELRGYTYNRGKIDFIRRAVVENLARLGAGEPKPAEEATPKDPKADKPAAAPAANAPAENTDSGDPVVGKISHVVLLDYLETPNPDPTSFGLVEAGSVASEIATVVPTTSTDNSGPESSKPAPTTQSWTPLGGQGGGSSGSSIPHPAGAGGAGGPPKGAGPVNIGKFMRGGQGMGAGGGPGPKGVGTAGMRGNATPGPRTGGGSALPDEVSMKKVRHMRTEFVILLVWKEPTPSDKFYPGDESAAEEKPAPLGGGLLGGPGGTMKFHRN
jgi:type IV pilus assembly protein PilM